MIATAIVPQTAIETVAPQHFDELHRTSGIHPDLIRINFQSLDGDRPYDFLCYADALPRTNTGRLEKWAIDLLAHTEQGGWWCSGLDPLNDWNPMMWGCFKPDAPRLEKQKGFDPNFVPKFVKYEHPLKTQTRAFFLSVSLAIGFAVALLYGQDAPDILDGWIDRLRLSLEPLLSAQNAPSKRFPDANPQHTEALQALHAACQAKNIVDIGRLLHRPELNLGTLEDRDFWPWIYDRNLPILVTEGAKKAASLLSQGYATIALPGISMGYRAIREDFKVIRRDLIPELQHFATLGRNITFCFDFETKPKTIQAVNLNLGITSDLLTAAGCKVKVVRLPGPEKGVDDFIVIHGPDAFAPHLEQALSLDDWQTRQLFELTVPPSLVVNRRYLGDIPIPDVGLALIKSPKDTGKTTALEQRIGDAVRDGRRVLVVSHRIQLCRGICAKLGINYVDEIWESDAGQILGFGLCIDSLHPNSQARFNPQDWRGAIVVLDEVEQVLWHVLNSTTCLNHRVAILQSLKDLMYTVLGSGGLVIAQDADLSDLSVEYLKSMAGIPIEPWLLVNEYKPEIGWDIDYYATSDPAPVVAQMLVCLAEGQRIFVCVDAQKAKSQYGSINLASYLQKKFPDKTVLRIDSETVCDPESPAFGIIEHLNEDIVNYDIVIATPSLGTGVSIDVRGHFGAVFGIFQGTIPDPEVRQALARVREPVKRYVWARSFSAAKVGNGSTHYRDLLKSLQQYVKRTVEMLKEVDFDVDAASDPISIRTWAKMAARVNASLKTYRESLRNGFEAEGHRVRLVDLDPNPDGSKHIKTDVAAERDANRQSEAEAVANAPDITDLEAARLEEKRAKTTEERHMQRKHLLQTRYGLDVEADLHIKDEDGWLTKILLDYYLAHDPLGVQARDKRHIEGHLERGNGQVALQDLRLFTSKVAALRIFQVERFMDPDRLLRKTDADLEEFAALAKRYRRDIKNVLGFTVHEAANPIQVLGMFLEKLGHKLDCVKREKLPDGTRVRVYQFVPPCDRREEVFALWQERDLAAGPQPDITDQITNGSGLAVA